jgi:hypothetical protein
MPLSFARKRIMDHTLMIGFMGLLNFLTGDAFFTNAVKQVGGSFITLKECE